MTNGDDDGGDDDKDDEMITATAAAVSDRLGLPASAEAQRPTGARPAPVWFKLAETEMRKVNVKLCLL